MIDARLWLEIHVAVGDAAVDPMNQNVAPVAALVADVDGSPPSVAPSRLTTKKLTGCAACTSDSIS